MAPTQRLARGPATHRSWPSSVGAGKARSSRPMLIRTWLVSGQTWEQAVTVTNRDPTVGTFQTPAMPQPHLQDDYVIVTERAELVTPGGIMADDLIDDILKVQCELFHCQVLALGTDGRELGVGAANHPLHPRSPRTCIRATHLHICSLSHGP